MKRLPKVLWVILAVFAFANGLEALRYLLPHVPFPAELDNFIHRRVALSLHAMGGAIALMAGPLQFLPRFRESKTGIVIGCWDGFTAEACCLAGALRCGSRRIRRPDGSPPGDF